MVSASSSPPPLLAEQTGRPTSRSPFAVRSAPSGSAAAGPDSPLIVAVTANLELLDSVLAVSAAAGVEPYVVPDAAHVRAVWSRAALVVVGVDRAAEVIALGLPRHRHAFVVGQDAALDEVARWSVPLQAAVVGLPSGAGALTTAIADAASPGPGAGHSVAVLGASGGVGASTFAAGLALVAARRQLRTMLVDLDPAGGGIDLLMGAERLPGWRWSRLAGARGHLGDLRGQLPATDEVDILSMDRGDEATEVPAEAVRSVVAAGHRSHDLVVLDVPRHPGRAGAEALQGSQRTLLVVQAEVRGVAAAREAVRALDAGIDLGLVVRRTRSRALGPEGVAESLGLPVLGVIGDDASLVAAAERGDPPARVARSTLARACSAVLDVVTTPMVAA